MPVLNQLHRVTARPVGLTDDAKTRSNTPDGYANALFEGQEIVTGVLAGMVASIDTATGLYKACDGTAEEPMGLFGLDAAGEPNEFNSAKNHGVMTLVSLGFHIIEVYETKAAPYDAAAADLTYFAGDKLYASARGLLEKSANPATETRTPIAIVEKAPMGSDVTMIIKLIV